MKTLKRMLAVLLVLALCAGLLPTSALALLREEGGGKPGQFITASGETVNVEDDWESVYPYGVFLFTDSEVSVAEGGGSVTVRVYRMGGTEGRATAWLSYAPAVMPVDEERVSLGSAAGSGDLVIEAEDALPAAQYQPLGKAPDPEPGTLTVSDEPYAGEDGLEGDRVLRLSGEAEAFQWQIQAEGRWQNVEEAVGETFLVSEKLLAEYDFRCVYTLNGAACCTDSYRGEVYEKPEPEVLPEAPEDLDLYPAQSFTPVETDPDDPYQSLLFPLTFAAGEWVKELRFTAPEDELAEAIKFGVLTIVGCEGGAVFDNATVLTVSVTDNDEAEPFTIGFAAESFTADPAEGVARLRLIREGGGQSLVTVGWSTADGTAAAGRDYAASSGEAVFYADLDEAYIEVPLIDSGEGGAEPRSFSVVLGGVKGDGAGLCTLRDTQARVDLSGQGTGSGANLVSMLYTPGVTDLSGSVTVAEPIAPVDERVITGEPVEIGEEELIRGEIEGYDAARPGDAGLMTYDYGRISFRSSHGGDYWQNTASVAGAAKNELSGWTAGSAYGSGWQISGDDDMNAWLRVAHMAQMYSRFDGKFEFSAGLDNSWHLSWGYVYGWAGLFKAGRGNDTVDYASSSPELTTTDLGLSAYITYNTQGSISRSWDVDKDIAYIGLVLKKVENKSKNNVYCRITNGNLTRRRLENDLCLRIHTANDGEGGGGNTVTAPEGAAALHRDSGVYESIKPEVTIVPGAGGVDENGRLYVGSQLRVSLRLTDSYKPLESAALASAVYLTRSDGSVFNKAKIERKDRDFYITMVWDDMQAADLEETFTINVAMTRVQKLEMDLSPSVPRRVDADGNPTMEINTSRASEAWDAFRGSGLQPYITVGCSETGGTAPHFGRIWERELSLSDWQNGSNPFVTLGSLENVQYINFNRSSADRIVFNGRSYAGNETIWLSVEDLSYGTLSFKYYSSNFVAADNVMNTSVVRVELYVDGDGDGRIAGQYNADTGYFVLDGGTADEFVMLLDEESSYDEVTFEPVRLDNGEYAEYFMKIYYTMTPRSLDPDGRTGQAQVLPALTTSITDPAERAQLTEAQRSYRYLLPGVDGRGKWTSDGHVMYGAEASRLQFVDVPLGGDRSPLQAVGTYETGYHYTWSPRYRGHLLYPFSEPEPIYIPHTLAGENYPLAEVSLDRASGSLVMDAEGRANLNGYLGSFVANTTIALCVTEQQHPVSWMARNPDSAPELQPECSTLIGRSASPDASYLANVDLPGMGAARADPSESDAPYQELQPDFGLDMSMLQTAGNFMGFVTVVTRKDEVTITASVPVLVASSKNGGKWNSKHVPDTVVGATNKKLDELDALFDALGSGGDTTKLESFYKNSGFEGMKGGGLSSTNKSAALSICFMISFKYDSVANTFYFKEFGGGAVGSLSFKYTYRLSVFPVVYVYASIGVSAALTSSGVYLRKEQERENPMVCVDQPKTLRKGSSYLFTTPYRNMNIQFQGKVFIEVLDSRDAASPMAGSNSGYLQSSGGKKITVKLAGGEGMRFASGESKFVRITALEDTSLQYLNVIEEMKNELTWGGVKVAPKLTLELGAGAGVDFMKVEACIKVVVSVNFLFGALDKTGEQKGFMVDTFRASASIMARAVFMGYTEEIEAIGIAVSYKNGRGWSWSWTHFGEEEAQLLEDGGYSTLRLPADTGGTQRIYSPNDPEDAELMAFEPDDPDVPFQLSGYGSSVNAFKMADGLDLGNDFQVIPTAKENYLLYTIGREDPASPVHTTMLVLSRVVPTGGRTGLVNPIDPKSETPYIPVDTVPDRSGALVDDGTADLEFEAWFDRGTQTIHVAWVSYKPGAMPRSGLSERELFQWSARNTVVKYAAFNTNAAVGFPQAAVVDGGGSHLSRPMLLGKSAFGEDVAAFVRAEHVTEAERAAALEKYSAALRAIGCDPEGEDEALRHIGRYRLSSQADLLDACGKQSSLCVCVDGEIVSTLPVGEGQVVDNAAFARLPFRYHVAFTTRELQYTDAAGNRTQSAADCANLLTICRLYLASFRVAPGGEVTWETPVLLRTIFDYENNDVLSDGLYVGGRIEPCKDPYFANLHTVTAALNREMTDYLEPQPVLLFEMNGSTYLIPGSSLESFTTGEALGGTIYPFFTPKEGQTATGRAEVTIGADGEGGLSAVYVGTAEGSTNNALYVSKYDSVTGAWGKGTMLAMNHMDVYEDAIEQGWTPEETEQAFLGRREGYDRGGMDQFLFSTPQIAMGVKAAIVEGSTAEQTEEDSCESTLLILTRGSLSYLKAVEEKGETYYIPDEEAEGPYQKGVGFYVISYGIGRQTIGRGSLSFLNNDFTAGAELSCALSFTNTGDVSIRGSAQTKQAITVTLSAEGEGVPEIPLQHWTITENILPGRKVQLSGDFTLPVTLPEGSQFHLSVSEGDYYHSEELGGRPYSAALRGLLTVEKRPELGFESADFALQGLGSGVVTVDENGFAVLDVDFTVGNRGNADAADVYVQFLFNDNIKDMNDEAVYMPLDLSISDLRVGEEEELAALQDARLTADPQKGILSLGNIRQGFGRRVQGSLSVQPGRSFCLPGAVMEVRVEIFSAADTDTAEMDGTLSAVHGEYNSLNNVYLQNVNAVTSFLSADHLLLAKGSILRLPIHYVSVCMPGEPDIHVTELPDNEAVSGKETRFQYMDQNLDLAYFEEGSFANGRGRGTLVLRASEEGNGYVRLMDVNNNSYRDIAFTVTAPAEGMDVYVNNGRFRFLNADGSEFTQAVGSADWTFITPAERWGEDPAEPYLKTLARAKPGASFTFETVAESMTLALHGEARIESDFPGFAPITVQGWGGSGEYDGQYAFVYFGANPEMRSHTVKITVTNALSFTSPYAEFDRVVEHYSGDFLSETDKAAADQGPQFYQLSSFPYRQGWNILFRLAVFSPVPLQEIDTMGPVTIWDIEKHSPNWWTVTVRLDDEGECCLRAVDQNGNYGFKTIDLAEIMDRILSAETFSAASLMDDVDWFTLESGSWLHTELLEGEERVIQATLDDSIPAAEVTNVLLYLGEGVLDAFESAVPSQSSVVGAISDTERVKRYPAEEEGFYVLMSVAMIATGTDPAYAYQITGSDGTILEEGNALDHYAWSIEFFFVEGPQNVSVPSLSVNRVALPDPAETLHGSVSADAVYVLSGGRVTLTLTPEAGWEAAGVTVTDAWNSPVAVTENADGTYSFIMPDTDVSIAPQFRQKAEPAPKSFADVSGSDWYAGAVDWAVKKGLMNGVSDTLFAPDAAASRAMVVTILWRLEGEKEGAPSPFLDVPAGAWFAPGVDWAAETGVVKGVSETAFSPDTAVTREQLAAILYRYAQSKGCGFTDGWSFPLTFTDADQISDYAWEAICWMTMNGVLEGMGDGTLAPRAGATRAQTAAIFRRFCGVMDGLAD